MRILHLDLIAFGPFKNTTLVFETSEDQPGLHLIYGPNEAGKSSTLRALRAALFGFAHQTRDNFRHANPKLRVGATLEGSDGQTLSFIRRKGKKSTLYAADDRTALADNALHPFLGGVREEEFFHMFALGHDELQEGGESVLKEHGRLGEIIFGASAGLPRLRRLVQALDKEAGAYFLPTGKNPKINEALFTLAEKEQLQKSLTLRPETFLRCAADLEQAQSNLVAVEADRAALRREKARLDRISQAIPTAVRWRQVRDKLNALGDVPQLPDDFTSRRETLERKARELEGRLERLRDDLNATVEQLELISVPDRLLDAAPQIDRLKERLGSHKTAARDLELRKAEAAALHDEIAGQLQSVYPDRRLDAIEELRLTRQERAAIRETASRIDKLAASIQQGEEVTSRLASLIAEADAALEQLGPATSADRLRQVVRDANRQGDIDGVLAETSAGLAALSRRIDEALDRLPLWSGPADDLLRLPVPEASTIERFENEFATLAQHASHLEERRTLAERGLQEVEQNLQREVRGADVPSEQSLRESRHRRDLGWSEVRRDLEGRGPGDNRSDFLALAAGKSLPDAFEEASRNADEIADRLRREAERIERVSTFKREAEAQRTELDRIASDASDVQERRAKTLADWKQQWPFLEPLTPREMRDWSTRHAELVRQLSERQALSAKAAELSQRLNEQRTALVAALSDARLPGESSRGLAPLVDTAERVVAELDTAGETRRSLRDRRDGNERDLRAAQDAMQSRRQELEALDVEWSRWKSRLDLAGSTTCDGVLVVLDTLDEIFTRVASLRSLHERIAGMQERARRFSADVRAAAARLVPEIQDRPAADAAAMLHARLDVARSLRNRRDSLLQRREQLEGDLAAATGQQTELRTELAQMCRLAGCRNPDDLPAIEQRAAERRRLVAQSEQAEEELCQRSGGQPLGDFLAEIDAADADGIGVDLERTARSLEDVDPRHKALVECVAKLTQERSRMAGVDDAAKIAEDIAAVRAQLAGDIGQYACLKFAGKLLRDGRNAYRQKTGNAILDRAGDQFAILTNGNFTGLTTDPDQDDEPLLGVRADETTLPVEGMSDGTTDQLYLALRLAALSSWMESHEPLPLVVDDILVHFDDARSTAALRALAALSQRTQIILFTHHEHIVNLARRAVGSDTLHIHSLDTTRNIELTDRHGESKLALF